LIPVLVLLLVDSSLFLTFSGIKYKFTGVTAALLHKFFLRKMPRLIDDEHDSTPLLAMSREKESSSPWLSSSKRTILFIALLLTCFSAVFGIHSSPGILAAGGEMNGSGQKSYLPLASLGANGGGITDAGDELNNNNNNMNRNNNMNHNNIVRSEKDQALLRNEFNDEEDINMNVNNNNNNKKELDKKRSSKDNNNNNNNNNKEKNKEISTTKIPTPPDELPQGRKSLFSLFTIYRKNVAPQLGDFESFAKDLFNDKPAAKSNEDNEDEETDYDEEISNSHVIRGW
jgi:hypothetical protein